MMGRGGVCAAKTASRTRCSCCPTYNSTRCARNAAAVKKGDAWPAGQTCLKQSYPLVPYLQQRYAKKQVGSGLGNPDYDGDVVNSQQAVMPIQR
jgi:hypothetical protein